MENVVSWWTYDERKQLLSQPAGVIYLCSAINIYLILISTCKFNFLHRGRQPALQNLDMDITFRAVGSDQPETSRITGGDVSDNSSAEINLRPAD